MINLAIKIGIKNPANLFFVCSISLAFDDQLLNLGWWHWIGNVSAQPKIFYIAFNVACNVWVYYVWFLLLAPDRGRLITKAICSHTRDSWNSTALPSRNHNHLMNTNQQPLNQGIWSATPEDVSNPFQGLVSCSLIPS